MVDRKGLGKLLVCWVLASGASAQVNLLENPGADDGECGTTSGFVATIEGWTDVEGRLNCIRWDAGGGFPVASSPGPSDRGSAFFQGAQASLTRATQLVDLTDRATEIDAGIAGYAFEGWLGGFSSQNDQAQLSATFLDAGLTELETVTLGPVTAADRGSITGLLRRGLQGTVPVGTRSIVFELTFRRFSGLSNDGYADSLSFTLTGFTDLAVPEPDDSAPDDRFGEAVATEGNLVAVGRPGADGGTGEVRIYRIEGGALVEDAVLSVPADRLASNFGATLALSDGRILIGAPGTSNQAKGPLAPLQAALYQRLESGWQLKADFSSEADDDEFGSAIAMDGSLVVIGAPGDDSGGANAGAAYLFELDGDNRNVDRRQVLPPAQTTAGRFGQAVAAKGLTTAIGAPGIGAGVVQLYGVVAQNLGAIDDRGNLSGSDGAGGDGFGASIALDGTTMAIGAPGADGAGTDRGAVYAFDPNSFTQRGVLVPGGLDDGAAFGTSVATASGRIAAGAPGAGVSGALFTLEPGFGQFFRTNGAPGQTGVGTSVAISETIIATGAPETNASAGSALALRDPGLLFRASFE